jgi:hypothetical protein
MGILLSCTLLFLASACALGQTDNSPLARQGQPPTQEVEQTFALREVSVFDLGEQQGVSRSVPSVWCSEAADANVVAYPTFKSQHPIYGSLITYLPEGHIRAREHPYSGKGTENTI